MQVAVSLLAYPVPWQQLAGMINSWLEKSALRGHIAHFVANLLQTVSLRECHRI